jgi:hypothetical protein
MDYVAEFSADQMFDKDSDYDLFICSCSFALSDLLLLNKEIGKPGDNSSLYFRMCIGFVREAYELMKDKFTNKTFCMKYLDTIESAVEKYNEIDGIVCGRTEMAAFTDNRINDNRHLVFHYPKTQKDYRLIQGVLEELGKEEQKLRYVESDDADPFQRQRLEFAEIIQYNLLFGFYLNESEKEHEIKLKDLATFTAMMVNLLNLLIGDFFTRKLNKISGLSVQEV